MRIALHHASDVAQRCGRVLLGERDLELIGLVDGKPSTDDARVEPAGPLDDYDLIVTDATARAEEHVRAALAAGISCVLWTDGLGLAQTYGDAFAEAGTTLLVGSNLSSGITPALASHEQARSEDVLGITIAWTEPGTPLRRGEAIAFPDPVGSRWAKRREAIDGFEAYVAPVVGEWAAAMARVTGAIDDGVITRVVGAADHAAHLEGLALAAGVIAVAQDTFSWGAQRPIAASEAYLAQALFAGLEVAVYSLVEHS